jgi:hypothetical protein
MSSAMLSPALAAAEKRQASIAGLSLTGIWLFIVSLLVVASGFTNWRPEVGGLLVHPYLVPVALAFPFVVMARIGEFPVRILVSLMVFTAVYSFSAVNGGNLALGEIFKTGTTVATIITVALLVRRRGDMVAGALGLAIAIAILAVNGLQDPTAGGVEAIQGANKNSYSLFALPAILMSGYIALRMDTVPKSIKTILIASMLPALAAIFMSGNRSGYVGALVVALMLFWDRRGKGLLLVGFISAAVAFWIVQYGSTKVLDEKMHETVSGYAGDRIRRDILYTCLDIGLENPIIGVSPQILPFEIGRRLSLRHNLHVLEAHNIFAHLFAASGVLCLGALFAVGWTMCVWKPRGGGKVGGNDDPLRDAVRLMRMMVVLWFVRGNFTRDILFNPSFNIGLGLAIGLCMLAETARKGRAAKIGAPAGPECQDRRRLES